MIDLKNEEELIATWRDYNRTRSIELRNLLSQTYLPLVKIVAGKLAIGLPTYVDRDDFLSTGFLGLIQAIERYDIERGVKFETFATVRIRGSILDYLRVQDWVPTSVRQKAKNYQSVVKKLEDRLGRVATDKEIAKELSVSQEQLSSLLSEIQVTTVLPLEDFYKYEESGKTINTNFAEVFEKAEVKETLAKVIDKLKEKERMVISLYYYEELTLKEISLVMNLSEARISQLHTKAISKLKESLVDLKENLL